MLVAVGAGSGGTTTTRQPEAPPIAAVARPAPPEVERLLAPRPAAATGCDFSWDGAGRACQIRIYPPDPQGARCDDAARPTSEQLVELQHEQQRYRRQIESDPASPPREIAELPLDGGGTATLSAWRTTSGSLCLFTLRTSGDGEAFGPCTDDRACAAICVDGGGGYGPPAHARYLLVGVVDANAEAIRVTVDGGATTTYGLTGPVVPVAPDRLVFMLDLGSRDCRRLELLEAGRSVVASRELPPEQVRFERCATLLPAGPGMTAPAALQPFQNCVAAAK